MKTKLFALLLTLVFTIIATARSSAQDPASAKTREKPAFRQDRIIVKFKERAMGVVSATADLLHREVGTETFQKFTFQPRLQVDVITGGRSVAEVIEKYKSNPGSNMRSLIT